MYIFKQQQKSKISRKKEKPKKKNEIDYRPPKSALNSFAIDNKRQNSAITFMI